MSTRCTINFCYSKDVVAKIYRHYDGMPDIILGDLESFFMDVEDQCEDTRFYDPSYLAAKFVVWQAEKFCNDKYHKLNFLGLGILDTDPFDIAYTYMIDCNQKSKAGYPVITHKTLF